MTATSGQRARTRTVLQMDPTESGAAALTSVLNFLGRSVRLQEVREACSVARDGVSTDNMVAAATRFGFTCSAEALDADALGAADLAPPYLASWKPTDFVVVEELGPRRARLNDPASGHRRVSRAEFDASYDGTVITLAPAPGFRPDPPLPRRRPTFELIALLARSGSGIVYALLAGVALVVPTTAAAMLTAIFVAQVLEQQNHNWAGIVIFMAVVVGVLLFALSLIQQRILLRLRMRLSIRMSAVFLWHLLRVPTRFFDSRSPGGLVSRVQFNNYIAHLLSGDLATAAISVVTMTLFAVVLAILSPVLATAAIIVALFNLGALLTVSRARTSINQQLQQTLVRLSGYTYIGINMIDDIKATGAEDEYFARWTGIQAEALNANQRLGGPTQGLLVVPGFLALFNFVVILAVGGELVIDGTLSLAHLIAFQILAASFF
ncbi:MAG: hypothetical protein JOY55_22565, partial [Mycobacterium sp.]|nr:hypothetical protein [Mycobacterium sp.]